MNKEATSSRHQMPLDLPTQESRYLRSILCKSVRDSESEAVLLSGGIDSSVIAALDTDALAITVGLKGSSLDLIKAQKVVQHLGMKWHPIELSREEAKSKVYEIIALTNSYDPAVLNDIPTYTALRHARSISIYRVSNGEFADTLFAGYDYMKDVQDIRQYIADLVPNIVLATSRIGDALGISSLHPYLNQEVINFVQKLHENENIQFVNTDIPGDHVVSLRGAGDKKNNDRTQRWTKILLRRSALGLLPLEIIFRPKADLEFGSGMNQLSVDFASEISDQDFDDLSKVKKFWNKMHARFYQIFTEIGLSIKPPINDSEYACTWCGGGVKKGRQHCLTCGGYKSNEN